MAIHHEHSRIDEVEHGQTAEIKEALEEARSTVESYQDILIAAAHEMRTPLHAIGLHLEILKRLSSHTSDRALISQIELAKRVLDGYVRRTSTLLDVGRVTAGVFTLNPEPIELGEIVTGILELYAAKADFQHARIEAHVEPGLVGQWDRAAVETILANLVSNALKYGEGAPVAINATADDVGNVVIRVNDKGPGIKEDQRTHIFEKFSRAVQPNSTITGYGLGLWIAQQLASLHSGSIVLETTSHHGSTFVVTLPLRQTGGFE